MGLDSLSLYAIALIFLVAGCLVWIAGTRLAYHGDELATRFGLTKGFVGLIFLAAVTELPEIVTTLTGAHVDNAALVLGNMFGGITMQTAILAVADFFAVRYALSSWPRKPTHALLAVLLIILLSALLIITVIGDASLAFNVGIGAICLSCGYPLVIVLLRNYDEMDTWTPVDMPHAPETDGNGQTTAGRYQSISNGKLILHSVAYSFLILLAGIALAITASAIADRTGLGSSFIGVTLLAASTSLPELSTTLAAARIGAYTMAISNIFGSNLIMLALILPADLMYRGGPILAEADAAAKFSIATGILVTAIYAAGILIRRTPQVLGAGLDSWLVMTVYSLSIVMLFHLT